MKPTIDDSNAMMQLNKNIDKSLEWLDSMGDEMKTLYLEFIELKDSVEKKSTPRKDKILAARRIQEILKEMDRIKNEKRL